jgi:cbb3-type cytochrome oxidase maturation protein
MLIIVILISISLAIALLFLGLFLWSMKSGQYEDTYTPSVRMLFEDKGCHVKPDKSQDRNRPSSGFSLQPDGTFMPLNTTSKSNGTPEIQLRQQDR